MTDLIPVKYLYLLSDFLKREYEIELVDLCAKSGLNLPQDHAELVSPEDFSRACELGINKADDPLLGLKFGNTLTFTHFGPLGAAMMSSKTISDILDLVTEFSNTSFPFKVEITVSEEFISVSPQYSHHFNSTITFHALTFITGSICFFKEAAGFIPSEIIIELPIEEPEDIETYKAYLPAQLRFNQNRFSTHTPSSYFEQPLPRYDEVSRKIFLEMCESIQQRLHQKSSLEGQISCLLDAYDIYPSLDQLSSVLAISPRTLRSRLHKEGATFRDIVNKHRLERAKNLLSTSTSSIEEIAERVGYSDTPSFYRAFKKDANKTPVEYRDEHKAS